MSTLAELTAQIIAARVAKKDMTLDELQQEMQIVSNMLKSIDAGTLPEAVTQEPETSKPEKINFKKIFKDNEVICLLCNKGFTTLKRHLTQVHKITDKDYKKQFGIPAKQKLIARKYSEERKKAALDRGQGEILVKARAARAAKKAEAPKPKAAKAVKKK
jgi:predicted transcriptional regulator